LPTQRPKPQTCWRQRLRACLRPQYIHQAERIRVELVWPPAVATTSSDARRQALKNCWPQPTLRLSRLQGRVSRESIQIDSLASGSSETQLFSLRCLPFAHVATVSPVSRLWGCSRDHGLVAKACAKHPHSPPSPTQRQDRPRPRGHSLARVAAVGYVRVFIVFWPRRRDVAGQARWPARQTSPLSSLAVVVVTECRRLYSFLSFALVEFFLL
jgi:hypothetical protein